MIANIIQCSGNDYDKIARAITSFNFNNLPPNASNNMMELGFVAKTADLEIIGGITGKLLLGNCLSIDILWVEPQYRDQDHGTALLQTIENAARKYSSKLSIVDTFDFQALEFYQKNAYEIFGILQDCPCPGNRRYYLSKKL